MDITRGLIITVLAVYWFGVVQSQKSEVQKVGNTTSLNVGRLKQSSTVVRDTILLKQEEATKAVAKKSTPAIVMPALWITIIVAILLSSYPGWHQKRTRVTTWWEFLIFAFFYFNIASLCCMYLPERLDMSDQENQWLINGGVAAGIGFWSALILCVVYAKAIKVNYGYHVDRDLWKVVRIVYLAFVMIAGFLLGAVIIVVGINGPATMADRWLYAFGVILAVYGVAFPLTCLCVCIFGFNSYQKIEGFAKKAPVKLTKNVQPRGRSPRGSEKYGPRTSPHSAQRAVPIVKHPKSGQRQFSSLSATSPRISGPVAQVQRTVSHQSTGSKYYKQLIDRGNAPQVKSISQYDYLAGQSTAGPKNPSAGPSHSKRTPSQQSTGSNYYQTLIKEGDTPVVKSISQYGQLLASGNK